MNTLAAFAMGEPKSALDVLSAEEMEMLEGMKDGSSSD